MQPETLGRYRIVKELGRGAMGQVWLAHDPELDRPVAVKTVQRFVGLPDAERTQARERFLREARAAARLNHPGIVTVFDVGDADGLLYLAMEFVDGTTLDRFTRAGELLPVDVVVEMIAGIAAALDFAHAQGIVHRDVKPANLMRVGERTAKIMDFGLARPSDAQLTNDGTLLGTPSYMSPEQIRGDAVDGRSDLFSLAIVLFELVTGEKPFPGDTVSSIIYRIVNDAPRDASSLSRPAPPRLREFLERALAKDPGDRFATGEAFAAALRAAAARSPAAADAASDLAPPFDADSIPPPAPRRPPRTSPWPFVVVVVVLLGGAAGAAWYFRDRLPWMERLRPEPTIWQTQVISDPPGLALQVDGSPVEGDVVRYPAEGPYPTLSVDSDCRHIERKLGPQDAGGRVVLVPDPTRIDWRVEADPDAGAMRVAVNGERVGSTPVDVPLDLCRDNRVEVEAEGYRPAVAEIPAGATPMEARSALSALSPQRIPTGRLVLPSSDVTVAWYVDGKRVGTKPTELELPEGEHTVRAVNEALWIDVSATLSVGDAETTTADLDLPELTTLVVQAFPPNCRVYLRRPGGSWQYLDDTPMTKRLAVGRYEVRVKLNPTGEVQDSTVDLVPGKNPPVRISFARRS